MKNLTHEEKIEFLANYKVMKPIDMICKNQKLKTALTIATSTLVAVLLSPVPQFFWLAACIPVVSIGVYAVVHKDHKKLVEKFSNGKLKYRHVKQLEKEGIIDQWLKEYRTEVYEKSFDVQVSDYMEDDKKHEDKKSFDTTTTKKSKTTTSELER